MATRHLTKCVNKCSILCELVRFVCLFIGCLTAHRQLGHIGTTLGVDALSCHAQDVGRQTYWKYRDRTACQELTIAAHLGD